MIDHLLHDYQHWLFMVWGGLGLIATALIALAYAAFARSRQRFHEEQARTLATQLDGTKPVLLEADRAGSGIAVDTLFVLPDISNYTAFVSSKAFEPESAKGIIFGLLSAIIKAGGEQLSFSKMEGDAALFFADAERMDRLDVERTVVGIYRAFADCKQSLISEIAEDSPAASRQRAKIDELDLKIFVHRGVAQRFTYRGMIDHFGTEVTLLHKLLKNKVKGSGYVLVTLASKNLIDLGDNFQRESVIENFDHIGPVLATVFRMPSALNEPDSERTSSLSKSNVVPSPSNSSPPLKTTAERAANHHNFFTTPTNMETNMTKTFKTTLAAVALAAMTTFAFATDYTKGTVKKIDNKSGKVTVKHEELKNLDMPAMTMVFVPKDDAVMAKLKEGKNIEFVAERIKGKLTLVEVK